MPGAPDVPSDTRAPLAPKNSQIERRKQKNAKRLVNIAEYSRAMSALLSNCTAPITEDVLAQLKSKHPRRTNPVTQPCPPTSQHDLRAYHDDWDTLLPLPPSDSGTCPGSPRNQCTHPNNHTDWLHERDHRTRKSVEMDIDTHGGLPTPQSREMDMDPGPRKGSLSPGTDPNRKQSVENTPTKRTKQFGAHPIAPTATMRTSRKFP